MRMQSFPFAIIVSLTDPDNIIVVGARRREQVGDEMVCWEEDFGSRQSDQRPLSGRHDAKIFSSSVCWIGTQMQVGGQWFSAQILIALVILVHRSIVMAQYVFTLLPALWLNWTPEPSA
jgi:hypothetical protein